MASSAAADSIQTSIRQLIANGKSKTALDQAKDFHKAQKTPASEALVIEAYVARIQALEEQRMDVEAKSLLDLVQQRFPAAAARIQELRRGAGSIDDMLKAFTEAELSESRRAEIVEFLQNRVSDLSTVASSAVLPEGHPLRTAAAAIEAAFKAVTSGPVTDEQIALPEVSHRSPLAQWKLLIRAIAAFHRREDVACREYLAAMKPESAPARARLALLAILDRADPARFGASPNTATLVSKISPNRERLRTLLRNLSNELFGDATDNHILNTIRAVMQEARHSAPEGLELIKRHLYVRALALGIDEDRLASALGGAPARSAELFRALARAFESTDDEDDTIAAAAYWQQFRSEAVREGWFPDNGLEVSILYLHVAEILAEVSRDRLTELRKPSYDLSTEDLFYLDPEELYRRACTLDPHPDSFSQWLRWAEERSRKRAADVAKVWQKARPDDLEPVLYLLKDAEKRRAYPTALSLLAQAERIDSVNSTVRAARLRLLVSSLLRHLEQEKPHLAAAKLAEIEALPQSRQGDRPAFVEALRFVIGLVEGNETLKKNARAEGVRVLGSEIAMGMLASGLAFAVKAPDLQLPVPAALPRDVRDALPVSAAKIIALVKDMGVTTFALPMAYLSDIEARFPAVTASLNAAQLLTLGDMATHLKRLHFAWEISRVGLGLGGETAAKFLLLRARTVDPEEDLRRGVCLAAAAQLAREHHDLETASAAIELDQTPFGPDPIMLTTVQAHEVVKRERNVRQFLSFGSKAPDYRDLIDEPCDCPACRSARGDREDENDDDPIDEATMRQMFFNKAPKGMPREVMEAMYEIARQSYMNGEAPEETIGKVLNDVGLGKKKKGKHRK